ncbi:pectinesterase family protein [Leptodontidium sp. MPI-SDFR-AT-0119]|nr:pectinesterase family protein [Leptodontidium sp. MPI-SDFR-AT-0119]
MSSFKRVAFGVLAALQLSAHVGAQSSDTATSSIASSVSSTVSSTPTVASIAAPSGTVIVDQSGSGHFTAINQAVSYAQASAQPTVIVRAGTYREVITVSGTAQVTIVGDSSESSDYSKNQVIVSNTTAPLVIAVGGVLGTTWKNINFVNTNTGTAPAVSLRAKQNAFYNCQFVSSGAGTVTATNLGTVFIANSYIEGMDKLFSGYLGAYVYGSMIVPTASSSTIVYSKGYSTPTQFSQTVIDSCTISQKSGLTNTYVYLAGPNGDGSQAVFKYTSIAGFIAPGGVRAWGTNGFYGEYQTTGLGSFAYDSKRIDVLMTPSMLSNCTIDYVFANSFTGFTSPSTSWVDSSVLKAISAANVVISSSTSATSTSSSVTSSSTSLFTIASSTTSATSSTASSTSTAVPSLGTYVVSLTPTDGQYGSVEAAISALPADGAEKTILIMPGTYTEQININRTGKVILRGTTSFVNDFSQNQVKIQFSYGVATSAGQNELTPVINSKKTDGSGLALYNIDFINTFPQTNSYAALAADFYGTNMAAYGCSFIGFQDTLLANKGTQLFSNCYIEGSVDFIWGFSQAYFRQCYIATNTPGSCIAAQSRSSASAAGGYVFDACAVTYTGTYGSSFGLSYLGRPYSNFSVAVYKNSYIDKHINAAGWNVWSKSNPQTSNVLFGEYNNVGPSAWTASTTRASFATNLTEAQVAAYDLSTFMGSTSWIDTEAYNFVPSFNFTASGLNGTPTSSTPVPSATPSANSTVIHPSSGTTPPAGAILVSVGGTIANSFSSLTAALASLPADTTSQTIFMYPGSYTEQVSVNRKGPVTVIGYQSDSVGKTYTANQVTLTFSRGLSVVSPVAAGHTDAETAVIATATTRISFYNVNFINTDNLDGAIASYVTLAASVFVGWQDTLLTGNPAGYAYYESSYIEGAIDFIWGYSMSYFKGCTIGAKKAKSSITAHNRASLSAVGGYVFDQCLFTAAPNATADLNQLVYLGRPYNAYARVVVKYSYLDTIIQPAGWKIWSATDPRTDYVTFAEYQNAGPGNWENNTAARVGFGNATLLTSDTYTLSSVMASTSWIDMTYWDSIVTPQPAIVVVETGNSTTPPPGACIVSKTAITGKVTYTTIAQCIALLPTTSVVSTIFIYPGTYNEQLTFNRSGATIFQGYADLPTKFSSNQVIITNSAGVDTQGDASNSDSATFYSRGKNVKFYNINLVNTYGKAADYASLGFAIGNNGNASFYGCQIIGNQDTFNVNAGNVFAYNTYIEGSVDFIWGSGSMYFLSSTISPNTNGISITADKRATNTSIGGIVFDQCTVTPAPGSSVSTGTVFLGRPWNPFARVAYVQTYLDSCVSAAGWSVWSKSTPNTDTAFFGEYQNTGPGAVKTSRASFSHEMTSGEASAFQLSNFFSSTSWIDFTAVGISPFVASNLPATVTVTSTVLPTGSVPVVTSTSTSLLIFTTSIPALIVTKNVTEKVSSTILSTQPDVYKSTAVTLTETSILSITPAIVETTLTIQGSSVTTTLLVTSKVTALSTVTPAPVTQIQTITISDLHTSSVTPKPVSKVVTSMSTLVSTATSTPKGKTNTIKIAAPDVKVTQTRVTKTTTYLVTIPAGPTVTVKAKKGVTSFISTTSIVLKTTKTKEMNIDKRQATSSSSSVSTPTVTTFYTLPQSTSTLLVLATQTDTITSYILKTSLFPGQTFTAAITTTKVVPKTTTLPQSTSTILLATNIKKTTITLPTSTVLVSKTSTSKIPTPSVTFTSTITKTTTVKSTHLVTSTVFKTAKGAPTCGA